MAGGLGGLGGFGNVLQALGQSLLTSPSGNPFETLPANMQAVQQQREHLASLGAMSAVAEKLGIPKEIAANPLAMSLLIQQMNTQRTNALTQQYLGQSSSLTPPGGDTAAPSMAVPPPPGGAGGLGGLGGAAPAPTPVPPAFTAPGGAGTRAMVSPLSAVDPVAADMPAYQKALLNGIARPESGGKYNIRYTPSGGVTFAGFDVHPGIMEPTKGGQQSSASGRYQFTKSTWDSLVGAKTPFTPENQDRAAILLAQRDYKARTGRDLDADLQATGLTPQIAKALAPTWEGLRNPGSAIAEYNSSFQRYASAGPNQPATQVAAAAGTVPLPPPRPAQIASSDPIAVPAPSPAMQRVQDEARARGIGQSGAPLDQVAASGKSIPVPINPPALPAPTTAPATPSAAGAAPGNTTKAWAQQNFELSLKRIAVAEQAGLKGIVEAEKAKLPIYTKYLTPSEQAIRVQEAGLTGTPMGRAIIAGLPGGVQEKLAEQLVPGYEAPGTLEQKRFGLEQQKYGTSLDQQAWQRAQTELDRQQRERLATMTPAEKAGMAEMRNPGVVQAGRAAEVAQKAAEAAASTGAAARTKFAEQTTAAASSADNLMNNLAQARRAYEAAAAGGGTGPGVASDINRTVTARLPAWTPGGANEIQRQNFDSAIAAVASEVSRARNKGLGARSNMEHVLATADLPKLTSSSPKTALDAFDRLQVQLERARELDKRYGLFGGEQQMTPRADQAAPAPAGTTRSGVRWSVQ